MKQGLTELVCILDRSGSMRQISDEAISGFNSFIKEQREVEGDANVTVALFDNEYKLVHDNVNIDSVPTLTEDVYYPRGMTALYDAIGRTVDTVGSRLANTPEEDRPEKVIVAILTDGEENTSREYTSERIKDMITHQEETYNWQFVYLAANVDAKDTGGHFGMKSYNSIDFNANARGTITAFANISNYTSKARSATSLGVDTMASYVALTEDDVCN